MIKQLSVVIPTYNRCEYLKRTIALLLPQIERNRDSVQFIVGANSCDDDTDGYMRDLVIKYPWVEYHYFEEYAEVGESIIRTVDLAQGERIIIWGDDDIPYPYLIDYILEVSDKYPDVGMIYMNRLYGKDTKYGISGLSVHDLAYEHNEVKMSIEELVEKFTIGLGFISSIVFTKAGWTKGKPYYSPKHYGYEFLPIIVSGEADSPALHCALPMEIQRNPINRDFSAKWPLYTFVGVPNMMSDFDRWGVTNKALISWDKSMNSRFKRFVWNMMYTTFDRPFYKNRIQELNKYQRSWLRKTITWLIVYLVPSGIFSFIKKRNYK